MSEDPKLFDAGDYNLFRYCHNDPIDMTDPMGTEITLPPGPNHASPLMEESARQMLFSSSYGAIAYGMGTYAQLQQAMGSRSGGDSGLSFGYIRYTTGSKKFWDKWSAQFSLRWEDPEFRNWWSRAAAAADAYVIGPRAHSTLPYTMSHVSDGSSAVQRALAIRAAHQDRAANLTHYGYPGDPYTDTNTRLGLGSRNNILNPHSVALSPDKAKGTTFGGPVEVNGHFVGFYHDATSSSLTNRVDIYDPNGQFHY
jgi:hypothetical protein